MRRLTVCVVGLVAILVAGVTPAGADPSVLITDLQGPLGLSVGSDGTVYVTEAFGPGRLTAIDRHGHQHVLVEEAGTELAGVAAAGRGRVVYTRTVYDADDVPVEASLERVSASGRTRTVASTLAFEADQNPDAVNTYGLIGSTNTECFEQVEEIGFPPVYEGIIESHPYAVAIAAPGYVVADAAANAVLEVSDSGRVRTLAVLPPIPQTISEDAANENGVPACAGETFVGEPVPTDVEVARNGDVYVSLLPGFPENPGAGQVWRIARRTGATTLVADGLVTPVDIALAKDGTIYVAELFASQISTIRNGVVAPYMDLDTPGAIEIGRDGTIYATTGVFGVGSVVALN